MDRRTLLTIIVLAAVAFASWTAFWLLRPRDDGNAFTGPLRSDYTLDNFTLDTLDVDGNHAFTVTGPRLARRGDDESIYVDLPHYELIDNSNNVWKGTSDSAWVNKDGTIMKLQGKVAMYRVPTEKSDRIDLLTSDLTVTTDAKLKDPTTHKNVVNGPHRDKRMETAALATIIDPNNVSHGIGMKADLDFKTVELLSDVHNISQPAPRNGGK
jgi:lipopolysaccharide export system protein LptC